MKDRVREALFNLLGRAVDGKIAIDLFAGTAALALEAISRGAMRAVAIEMHRPAAKLIRQNAASLGIATSSEHLAERDACLHVITADAFVWATKPLNLEEAPWLVFCSPPYSFYTDRREDILRLLSHLIELAPATSLFAVEADEHFDFELLPDRAEWAVRRYPPAVLGLWEKPAEGGA